MNQPVLEGEHDSRGPVARPELAEDPPHVGFDRPFPDEQPFADLAVRGAPPDLGQDLELAGGQKRQAVAHHGGRGGAARYVVRTRLVTAGSSQPSLRATARTAAMNSSPGASLSWKPDARPAAHPRALHRRRRW